jgi:hypothetical protein
LDWQWIFDPETLVRHDLGMSKKESRFPKDTCLAIYSYAINSGATIKATLRNQFPWCIEWKADLRKLFGEYAAAKQRQNVLDYDDLLLAWSEMMNDGDLAAEVGDRFDHILVDEYQDTNRLQANILLKLKPDGRGREDGEGDAFHPVEHHGMSAELLVRMHVRAFPQQVEIEIGQDRGEAVRVFDLDLPVAVARAQAVVPRSIAQATLEQPGIVDALEIALMAFIIDDRDLLGIGKEDPNH